MAETYLTSKDLFKIATLSDPRFSPDGQRLAYVRTQPDLQSNGYRSAIWLSSAGGGHLRQFTSGTKRDSAPRWSPDGHWLAFVSTRGGEKAKPQLYLIATEGGEARQLTKMENGASEPAWSPDGRYLAFTSRVSEEEMAVEEDGDPGLPLDPEELERRAEEREKKEKERADPRVIRRFAYRAETSYFDERTAQLYILEVDTETCSAKDRPRRLTHDGRNYSDPQWMPDGGGLLAVASRKPGEDDLFYFPDLVRVPLDGGEPGLLTGTDTADRGPRPSPDGRWIAYNSQPVAGYSTANLEIKLLPAVGGEPRILTAELDCHAVDLAWMPDSQSLCFLAVERGRVDLRCVPAEGGSVDVLLTADREIQAYDLSPDGKQVGLVASTDQAPSDLYAAALDGSSERRLTKVNADWLAAKTLGEVNDLWFESADGTPIHGWIVKPPDFAPTVKYPLILSIHGGPHVMWSRHEPTMWHEWQVLAARGYVVFACNPRGSDGYGQDFRAASLNGWGEADLPDLQAGIEQVITEGYVDPERVVVTGGSYGGYMTAWVIGHDDRFKAAVAQRGVYDLTSFYSTSDIPILTEWEFDAVPWEDPQVLWKYSPLAYVEDIRTPLLLIHSENDFRAPIPAAEGLFVALRRLRRDVEMVRYPRDGHELSRSGEPKHRIDRLNRIADWFDKYVKDIDAPA
jgi:dipeptidyl aminopeptidase/acylaminoacyl peptidase